MGLEINPNNQSTVFVGLGKVYPVGQEMCQHTTRHPEYKYSGNNNCYPTNSYTGCQSNPIKIERKEAMLLSTSYQNKKYETFYTTEDVM